MTITSDFREARQSYKESQTHNDSSVSNKMSITSLKSIQTASPLEGQSHPRTVSRDGSGPIFNPKPDQQVLHGGYSSNIERLEESAESMSISSDIGEEIRKLCNEQKRSESRKSSLLRGSLDLRSRKFSLRDGMASRPVSPSIDLPQYPEEARDSWSSASKNDTSAPSPESRISHWQEACAEKRRDQDDKMQESNEENERRDLPPTLPEISSGKLCITNLDVQADSNTPSYEFAECEIERLNTPKSGDGVSINEGDLRQSSETARQRNSLFLDFDGVHARESMDNGVEQSQRTSATPRAGSRNAITRRQSRLRPHHDDGMVYYPAPVPMVLNLPKRLSQMPPTTSRTHRRSEMPGPQRLRDRPSALSLGQTVARQTDTAVETADGSPVDKPVEEVPDDKVQIAEAKIPPQLRATMFFEQQPLEQMVEVKGQSAVATLDSILDAAAFAPVSAFTDHPIAGQVGAEVYGRSSEMSRQRRSTATLLSASGSRMIMLEDTRKRNSLLSIGNYFGRRKSSGHLDESFAAFQDHHDSLDPEGEEIIEGDGPEAINAQRPMPEQPTTLLAELQMRKAEQKSRNRAAATAFPDGMHSTLLELDAVAQLQQRTRNKKQTRLAWEDPADRGGPDGNLEAEEDVPLAMLYQSAHEQRLREEEEQRPLGLIAQRIIEDNEPLTHRRARLRGEDLPALPARSAQLQESALPADEQAKDPESEEDEYVGESLAERIRRLKATRIGSGAPRSVSNDFASEVFSHLEGVEVFHDAKSKSDIAIKDMKDEDQTPRSRPIEHRQSRIASDPIDSRPIHNQHDPDPELTGEVHESTTLELAKDPRARMSDRPIMPQKRHSMADILEAHPKKGDSSYNTSNELKFAPPSRSRNTNWARQMNQQAGQASQLHKIDQPVSFTANHALQNQVYGNGANHAPGHAQILRAQTLGMNNMMPSSMSQLSMPLPLPSHSHTHPQLQHQHQPQLQAHPSMNFAAPTITPYQNQISQHYGDVNMMKNMNMQAQSMMNYYPRPTFTGGKQHHPALPSSAMPSSMLTSGGSPAASIVDDLRQRDMVDRWRQSVMR